MPLLRGTLVFLLIANTSVDANEKPAISANRIHGFSPNTFQPNGSSSNHCVLNSSNSSEQDHRHCLRSGDSCPNYLQ